MVAMFSSIDAQKCMHPFYALATLATLKYNVLLSLFYSCWNGLQVLCLG